VTYALLERYIRFIVCVSCATALTAGPAAAQGRFTVVTTTVALGSIAREIGGDRIALDTIAIGREGPGSADLALRLRAILGKAGLLIAPVPPLAQSTLARLIAQSANASIQPGTAGFLDTSSPNREDRAHPPSWLDPEHGREIAEAIAARLSELHPQDRVYFATQLSTFVDRLEIARGGWRSRMAPFKGTKVVANGISFAEFADRFGLDIIGYLEPLPGASRPQKPIVLIDAMRRAHARIVLVEGDADLTPSRDIASSTFSSVVVMPPLDTEAQGALDYVSLIDANIRRLVAALEKTETL